MNKVAKFNIGEFVVHKRQGYRAIIVDVDPIFQASGRYNPQAAKREFSQRHPWYRLLVDECSQMTYVEECLLECDVNTASIYNPKIGNYFVQDGGCYRKNFTSH